MSDNAKYLVVIEGAILRDNRYLLVVRGPEESYVPGVISLVGGKVEDADTDTDDVLENTVAREIFEEVGLRVTKLAYVRSTYFMANEDPVVNAIFLCQCEPGETHISDPGEVADILWLSAEEIARHPDIPIWTKKSIHAAEQTRIRLGW